MCLRLSYATVRKRFRSVKAAAAFCLLINLLPAVFCAVSPSSEDRQCCELDAVSKRTGEGFLPLYHQPGQSYGYSSAILVTPT